MRHSQNETAGGLVARRPLITSIVNLDTPLDNGEAKYRGKCPYSKASHCPRKGNAKCLISAKSKDLILPITYRG
jgi:hypothetical protein